MLMRKQKTEMQDAEHLLDLQFVRSPTPGTGKADQSRGNSTGQSIY